MNRIEYEKLKQEIDRFIDFLIHLEHSIIGIDSNDCQSFKVDVLDKDEVSAMDTKAGNKHTVSLKTNGSLFTFR